MTPEPGRCGANDDGGTACQRMRTFRFNSVDCRWWKNQANVNEKHRSSQVPKGIIVVGTIHTITVGRYAAAEAWRQVFVRPAGVSTAKPTHSFDRLPAYYCRSGGRWWYHTTIHIPYIHSLHKESCTTRHATQDLLACISALARPSKGWSAEPAARCP